MDAYPKIYLYRRVVRARLHIDSHFSENLDLNNISDEAHFSKFHFLRLFKQIYGKTPHQYLIQVRIQSAEDLLRQGNTVSQVCFAVGFNSVSSFTGLFKKCRGITPSEFQQRHQRRQVELKQQPLRFIPNCFAESHGWSENRNFREVTTSSIADLSAVN